MNFNKSNRTEWKKLNLQRYQGYHSRKGWFSWKTDGESAHFLNEIPRNDFIRKVIADYPGIWLNGGSGGAELDLFLTKLGISVNSMDISANCLGEGRKNFKAKAVNAIQYVVSDLENLPLRDESLDGARAGRFNN